MLRYITTILILCTFLGTANAADLIQTAPPPSNPSVSLLRSWGNEIGTAWRFGHREWCGLYACIAAHRAGLACPGYTARSFYSLPRTHIRVGVFAVIPHHVGIVTAVHGRTFTMLSGNTGNKIKYTERPISGYTFVMPVPPQTVPNSFGRPKGIVTHYFY